MKNIQQHLTEIVNKLARWSMHDVDYCIDSEEQGKKMLDVEYVDDEAYHVRRSGIRYIFYCGKRIKPEVPKSIIKLVEKTIREYGDIHFYQDNVEYEEKKRVALLGSNKTFKTKYFIWEWVYRYGWRPIGSSYGYDSIEECHQDNSYIIENSDNWNIVRGELCAGKLLEHKHTWMKDTNPLFYTCPCGASKPK